MNVLRTHPNQTGFAPSRRSAANQNLIRRKLYAVTYTYDTAHRLTGVGDVPGNSLAYTLDATGNLTEVQALNGSGTVTVTCPPFFDP